MNPSDVTHPDVIVGELTLVDGQRLIDVAHMALMTPPRRAHGDRRSETLLVFLDLGGRGGSGLAQAMLEHFSRTYWRCSGPVTSSVRQAINAANTHLRDENRLMPVSHRRRGGLVCAVLRDDHVYLAHVGPAKALVMRDRQETWFATQPEDGLPLGVSTGLDIRFAHSFVNAGDRLLLTGESWTGDLPDIAFANTLRDEGVTDVMLALERQDATGTLSAMVVECAAREESPPLPSEAVPSYPVASLQEPLTPAAGTPPDEAPQGSLAPVFEPTYVVQTASEPVAEPVSDPKDDGGLSYLDAASTVSAEVTYGNVITESRPLIGFSLRGGRLDRTRRGLGQTVEAVGSGARVVLRRVLPDPARTGAWGRRQGRDSSPENVPVMAGVAIAIPLLVAFLVVTFYLQRGDSQRHEVMVNQARAALEAARLTAAGDDRALWNTALETAEEALLSLPDDEELLAVRDQARVRLDELGTVVRPDLTLLWDYGPGQERRLAATRSQVYVLDTVQDEVTQQTLAWSGANVSGVEPDLVTYRDLSVSDEPVGGLHDAVWLSAADPWIESALLILTEDNRLLQHNPSWGLSWVPMDSGLTTDSVRVLEPYDGKLYALDPVQNEVWRIPYDGEKFGPPQEYFTVPVPDLGKAVDMTIDGAVYILLADGTIYKFFGGESVPFNIRGLPGSLSRPIALVSEGDETNGALYVANADTQSIVVLSKDGKFINQFKAADEILTNLEALAIDQDTRTLFVLANGYLYAMALPLLPEPPTASN
jgi:hypothetical protein